MLNLGGVRDSAEFNKRLGVTAALFVAYRLGTYIPLPGIDAEALSRLSGPSLERISILALGVTPFMTILILAELLKVVAPPVRRWEQADLRNRDKLNRIVVGLSLLAAAAQASGLALALEDVGHLVEEPGTPFRLTTVATLVGGAAIAIWLANQITRHGLGSGVWLLLVAPWIAKDLSHTTALAFWQGSSSSLAVLLLVGWAFAILLLGAIVGLVRAGGRTLETAATCLWSVLLANSTWTWGALGVALIAGGWTSPGNPILLLVLAVLVALFVYLYMRSLRIAGAAVPAIAPTVLAVALAAIALADIVLTMQFGFVVSLAGHLILIAVVAMSILALWWQPPFEASAAVQTHDEPA